MEIQSWICPVLHKYFHFSYSCNSVRFTSWILNPPQIFKFHKSIKESLCPSLRCLTFWTDATVEQSRCQWEASEEGECCSPKLSRYNLNILFHHRPEQTEWKMYNTLFWGQVIDIYLSIYYIEKIEDKAVERTIMCPCNFNFPKKQNTLIKK